MAFEDRPPMTISVIIDSAVDKQKVQLFKKILPEIARLRFDRGDELKFSTGKLDKAPAQEPIKAPEPSWLDNVVKYKDTLIRLLGGIVAAIGVLLILQAVLRAVFPSKFNEVAQKPQIRPRSNQTPEPREADNSDKSQKAASALPGRGSEIASKLPERVGRLGLGGINRNQLFSRDSLLYHTLLELNQEATDHPERLAQMLVEWISVGKKQAAATLLNNFDMKIAERILERMSDSDVDLIQPFFSGQLDPFSEENHKVVNEARHDLIRLTAKWKKDSNKQDLRFLSEIDDDLLSEVLKGETAKTLAVIASQISAYRLSSHLRQMSEPQLREFFTAVCNVGIVPEKERAELAQSLKKKVDLYRNLPLTDSTKADTIADLLMQLPSGDFKRKVLAEIEMMAPNISYHLRKAVFFFEDVPELPEPYFKILTAQLDPMTVVKALSPLDKTVKERVKAMMTKSVKEIFVFEESRNRQFSEKESIEAQEEMLSTLHQLVSSKAIDPELIKKGKQVRPTLKKVAA
jgi:flagellar motor switch protein FliG